MSDRLTPTRRRLLTTTGGLLAVGLAGCAGSPGAVGDDTPTPNRSTTAGDHHEGTESGSHHGTEHHDEGSDGTETAGHHEAGGEHHTKEEAHAEGGHGAEGPAAHVEVEMQTRDSGYHFHPHVAWVEPGGTVTFRNVSGSHTATAYHPDTGKQRRIPEGAEPFDSGLLTEEGATFEHTFETEGVYDVYCEPHEQLGMIGSVVVGRPDPHDQAGLAEPHDGMSEAVADKIAELNGRAEAMLGHEH